MKKEKHCCGQDKTKESKAGDHKCCSSVKANQENETIVGENTEQETSCH